MIKLNPRKERFEYRSVPSDILRRSYQAHRPIVYLLAMGSGKLDRDIRKARPIYCAPRLFLPGCSIAERHPGAAMASPLSPKIHSQVDFEGNATGLIVAGEKDRETVEWRHRVSSPTRQTFRYSEAEPIEVNLHYAVV